MEDVGAEEDDVVEEGVGGYFVLDVVGQTVFAWRGPFLDGGEDLLQLLCVSEKCLIVGEYC